MRRNKQNVEDLNKVFDTQGGRLYKHRDELEDPDEADVPQKGHTEPAAGGPKFDELALALIASLKSLMVYAN